MIGDYVKEITNLKKALAQEFEIKDLGNLKYFLGKGVAWSKRSILDSQQKYVLDLLKEPGMLGCKLTNILMESTYKIGLK